MSRTLHGCLIALTFSGIIFLGTGAFLFVHLTRDLDAYSASSQKVLTAASGAITGLQATLTKLNGVADALDRPPVDSKGHLQPQGTIENLNDLVHDLRLSDTQFNQVIFQEKGRIDTLNGQEADIAAGTEQAIAKLGTGLDTVNTTMADAQPVLAGLTGELADLRTTTQNLNSLVPPIKSFIGHSDETMANLDATTADTHKWLHVRMFPPPCKTLGCRMEKMASYLPPLAKTGEAVYWSEQLFENAKP